MLAMVQKGQWLVLPYQDVANLPNLRISPLGVVPQRDRRPRTIADYTYSGVNADTVPLTDHLPLQFGCALLRILRRIVQSNPAYGPVYLIKLDLADGFYRIHLAPQNIPLLGVAFPTLAGTPQLVAFPLALPMGWTSSPPFFCAATETIADITNIALATMVTWPPHRLEPMAELLPIPVTPPATSHQLLGISTGKKHTGTPGPLAWSDVFVDDHLALAQGTIEHRQHVRRTLLHSIDRIFRPLAASDSPSRQEPVSLKKLAAGDGQWSTTKTILGWVIDTVAMTITLPPHRAARLHAILEMIPRHRSRIAVRQWHQLLGELRSMMMALPGSRGLFSTLQEAFSHREKHNRLRLNTATHDFLDDFRWLAQDLTGRPTRIQELVPQPPTYIGSCDASGQGMGGVWFPPNRHATALLWRAPFPLAVQRDLVSASNLTGKITNSDLELLGAIAHQDILTGQTQVAEMTHALFNDNLAAIHWLRRGSVTTTAAAAYLLRLQALHRRHHRYNATYDYLPGKLNTMADDCSRLWHLSDTDLLTHFNLHYPQAGGWTLCHLSSATYSALISALQHKRLAPELYLPGHLPLTVTGPFGQPSVQTSTLTPTFLTNPLTPYSSSGSLPYATAPDDLPPVVDRSSLAQWKMPSVQWARRWPYWGPRTLGLTTWEL